MPQQWKTLIIMGILGKTPHEPSVHSTSQLGELNFLLILHNMYIHSSKLTILTNPCGSSLNRVNNP